MSAVEVIKHFEALASASIIGPRMPSDRAWRRHAAFRAALHTRKRNRLPNNNMDTCESRLHVAVVEILSWRAFDVPFFAVFARICATSKNPEYNPRTCTPPRSCLTGDLQCDRMQRLFVLPRRRHIAGSRNGSLRWRCCGLWRT
jgi:hypothetical protein